MVNMQKAMKKANADAATGELKCFPKEEVIAAMIGIPDHSFLLYLNLYVRFRSTSFRLDNVLLLGLNNTSE